MEPWQSWAIALAGGGLAYFYYTKQNQPRTRSRATQSEPANPKIKRRVDKRAELSTPDLSSDAAVKKTKKRKAVEVPMPSTSEPVKEDNNDKAWAEQMASLKKGTSLAPPATSKSHTRTVKQSTLSSPAFSSNSSMGDADADDDLSPAVSPALPADVSDMLEPAAPGPSILRLTSPAQTQKREPRPVKEQQAAETKKQRQNRKKVEEKRAQREASEQERQSKLESQRRVARESRGEPARNGTSTWKAAPAPAKGPAPAPLLDTFEQSAGSTSSSAPSGPSTVTSWENDLPEEDQIRLATKLSEDESGWNTVSTKKRKPAEEANGTITPVKVEKPKTTNGFSSLDLNVAHPDDSQWSA